MELSGAVPNKQNPPRARVAVLSIRGTAVRCSLPSPTNWAELPIIKIPVTPGSGPSLRAKTKTALRKIKVVFPGLILGRKQGGIEILPGASAVPPKRARQKALPPVDQVVIHGETVVPEHGETVVQPMIESCGYPCSCRARSVDSAAGE
jgi:hypothetical protein